jgi:hypothetical protein
MSLLRPSPLGDFHLHFLAFGIQEDEFVLIDRHFDGIAHNQPFAGISRAAPQALAACGIDDVLDLDREDRPSVCCPTVKPFVVGDADKLTRLEFVFRSARDTGNRYQRQNQPKLGQEALSCLLNAFHHTSANHFQLKGHG